MDRRIVIERQSTVVDDLGVQPDVWTELTTVFAEFSPSASRDTTRARAVYNGLDATFKVRWRDTDNDGICDYTSKDRIKYKAQIYEIVAVEPQGRKESIFLYAKRTGDLTV